MVKKKRGWIEKVYGRRRSRCRERREGAKERRWEGEKGGCKREGLPTSKEQGVQREYWQWLWHIGNGYDRVSHLKKRISPERFREMNV